MQHKTAYTNGALRSVLCALVGLIALLCLSSCMGPAGVAAGTERGISYDGELKVEVVGDAKDGVVVHMTNADEMMSNIFIVRRVEFDGYAALVEDERVTSQASDGQDGFFVDLKPGESVDLSFALDGKPCTSVVLLASETLYVEGGTPYQYDDLRLEAHA